MLQTVEQIFESKKTQASDYYTHWKELYNNLKYLLENTKPKNDISIGTSIDTTDLELDRTIQYFKSELDAPRITLATSGTTSSGKSSLVNLLCGEEIVPVGVQETSAGVVAINHHPTNRKLKIPIMEGVPTEYSGEWSDLSDEQITQKLKEVMECYRKLRDENREPPPPRFELEYPTRLGMQPEIAGLPKGFKLRILDLPGLKYVADAHSKEIIHKEIKLALCLVTYNGEEADPEKQQVLLNEVVENVKELQGSLTRMLFILNKIDVFRRDPDFEIETQKFINKTTQNIRNSIVKALPEYSNEIEQLEGYPLSTYPALCSYQALNGSEESSIKALDRIDSYFNLLMPSFVEDLPRKIKNWKEFERKQVAEYVWQTSHGANFDTILCQHIQNHLPHLILPHLIADLREKALLALQQANQITYEYINAIKDKYERELKHLETVDKNLEKLQAQSQQELLSILTKLSEDKHPNIKIFENKGLIGELQDIAKALENFYKLPNNKLSVLHSWSSQIAKTIDLFMDTINESIKQNTLAPSRQVVLDSLPPEYREQLSQMLVHLQSSGYSNYATEGILFEAKNADEKKVLHNINQALSDLADVLGKALESLLKRVIEHEKDRIKTTLLFLIDEHTYLFNKKFKEMVPNLLDIEIPFTKLINAEQPLEFKFNFYGGISVVSIEKDVEVRTVREKVGERRLWYTLWLSKEDLHQGKAIYEKHSHDIATIPKSEDIFINFIAQARKCRPELVFINWINKQLDAFFDYIKTYQINLLKKYRQNVLEKAEEEKNLNTNKWLAIKNAIEKLESELDKIQLF